MFKAFLLKEENKEFLKKIIHEVTKIPLQKLENMKVQNIEHIINNKNDKVMRSDIIVSVDNIIINIEMNKQKYKGLFERNLEYLERISVSKNGSIKEYDKGVKLIQINFNNFHMEKVNSIISEYKYNSLKEKNNLTNNRKIYLIDLVLLKELCYNKPVVNLKLFEKQMLLIKAETKEEVLRLIEGDGMMEKAANTIFDLNNNLDFLLYYDEEEEREKVTRTRITSAKNEGIVEGEQIGLTSGINLVASNLLKENVDIKLISKATGLSQMEIKKLKNKNLTEVKS